MKQKNLLFGLLLLSIGCVWSSCKKEDDSSSSKDYSKGIFITNEGIYQTGVGTISYTDADFAKPEQDIFNVVNGKPLGNVVQSMSVFNNKAYIVVNNSAKIEVVNLSDFKSVATISGLSLPRYFLGLSDKKAYVTDWGGNVAIVDLTTNLVTGTIPTGDGPEQMLKSGNLVYVLNAGGYGVDHTITVINSATDQYVRTIEVDDRPTGIVQDVAGNIWVMCSGKGFNGYPQADDTRGALIRIDPSTFATEEALSFLDNSLHPEKLVINGAGTKMYFFYNDGIYMYDPSMSTGLPVRLCSHARLYSLAYDTKEDYLYATDPLDFSQEGWVIRFKASDGSTVDSLKAGVIPGSVVFNR